jgi:glycosyltransferase involved in cell wall biosynthesis
VSESGVSVSVVVCTYDGEKFLREQLQSILEQTRRPDEIIISDDGSRDSTLDIVDEIRTSGSSSKVPHWRVLTRETPLGVSGNFASALLEAGGNFIALADQDDVWEPDRLEKALREFSDGVLLVHSDSTLIDASGQPMGTLMSALRLTGRERTNLLRGRALDVLLRRNVITGATTVIRSSLVRQALPIPEGWVHDEWLGLVAAIQDGVVFVDSPLIRYRQHGSNEIGATETDYVEARRRLQEKRTDFFLRKLRRNEGILAMVAQQPPWLSSTAQSALEAKIGFDRWRSALPSPRPQRILPVLRRWISGDYGRYARGYLDVIRDISLTD